MAIGTPLVGAMATNATTGPITPATPAGIAVGDVKHLWAYSYTAGNFGALAGWELLGEVDHPSAGTAVLYRRVHQAGDADPSLSGFGNGIYGNITAYPGASTTTPEDVTVGAGNTGSGTTLTAPSVTTAMAGSVAAYYFAQGDNNTLGSPTGGATLTFGGASYSTIVGGDCCLAAAYETVASPGASGTCAVTASGGQINDQWVALTVAIRDAAAAVDVTADDATPAGVAVGSPSGESVEALSINVDLVDNAPAGTALSSPAGEAIDVTAPDTAPAFALTGSASGETVGVSVLDTNPAGVAVGSPSGEAVTAEEPGLPAGGAPFVSLWGVHPTTGALVHLPHALKVDLSPIRNSGGSFRFDYPAFGKNFEFLHDRLVNDKVAVELQLWVGGSRFNSLGGDVLQVEGDDVAEDSVWSFSGKFFTHRLARATVRHDPAHEKGERQFSVATAGTIMRTFLLEAQARGTLTYLDLSTFSTTHDSAGVPWSRTATLSFTPYGDGGVLTVLSRLVALGMCEGEVDRDKRLLLYNAGGAGRDLTTRTPPVILRRAKDLLESNRRLDVGESGTDVYGTGGEGLYASAYDASARARWGEQIEMVADSNQIKDQGALTAFVQNARDQAVLAPMELTHGLVFGTNRPAPVSGFRINDWLYSDVGRGLERVRVAQWVLSQDVSGIKGSVTLNDIIADRLTRLQRQIAAMSDGSAVVGTSTATLVDDVTPPAAPTGLVIDSIAYQDAEHSQTLAAVTVGWSPVTTNAAGPATERAQAAAAILARILSGDPIGEDWTWTGAPPIVGVHNDPLLAAFEAAEPDATSTIGAEGQAWLDAYVATNSAGSSATDDVAGYKVQLAYLGLSQVGGIPSSNPVDEVIAYNEVTPSNGIPDTSYTFGGVEAGANIAVRVAAFDNSGNQSAWSTPIGHDTAVDNVPPEAPSAPAQRIWFRTLDTAWDGLDFAGASMSADFDHVAVLMSQAASFTAPDPLGEPVLFDPLVTGVQHVANLYGAGTWNQPDLPVGVGWYSALVAVDRAGNVSGMSAITGPATAEQLVSQDLIDDIIDATKLGPDSVESQHVVNAAITSAKILDAAIVTAKIADLAVNNAKVETLDVGKLTAGTMTATVTNSGLFRTASSGNRVEFDSAGIRLYMGSTIVGRWQTSDASMLMTGTYQSALSGERINIFPDGTMRFYPVSGTNYSQLANFGNDLVMRGVMDGNSRSGRLNVNAQGAGMNFSAESEIPSDLRAEMAVFDRRARTTAPLISIVLDGKLSPADGTGRRVQFSQTNSSGVEITASRTFYTSRGVDGKGAFSGNGSGIVFDNGTLAVTTASTDTFGPITASAFNPPSSETVKDTIRDARADLDPLAVIRAARSKSWHYTWERWRNPIPTDEDPDPAPVPVEPPTRFGPIAEELPEVLQVEVPNPVGPGTTLGVSLGDQIGVLWGAIGQLMDQRVVHTSAASPIPGGLVTANTDVDVTLPWDGGPTQSVPAVVSVVPVGPGPLQQRAITVTVREVTTAGVTVRFRSKRALTGLSALDPDDRYVVNAIYSFVPPFTPEAA